MLINFYDDTYDIRHYVIDIFNLYNHKIMLEMLLELYNNNQAFAFSHCPQSNCDNDKIDELYSSLILFSYPNTIDYKFDIIT